MGRWNGKGWENGTNQAKETKTETNKTDKIYHLLAKEMLFNRIGIDLNIELMRISYHSRSSFKLLICRFDFVSFRYTHLFNATLDHSHRKENYT